MKDLAQLLGQTTANTSPFAPSSRYHGAPLKLARLPDGRQVRYVPRRLTPRREAIQVTSVHTLTNVDRLDLLAARYFGDPTQGWKILDANGVLSARDALGPVGARVAIGEVLGSVGQRFR